LTDASDTLLGAGLAGVWRPTEEGERFASLTTEPDALVGPIHPKAMLVNFDFSNMLEYV
jgi:putative SOS response-associated peptidase YedK